MGVEERLPSGEDQGVLSSLVVWGLEGYMQDLGIINFLAYLYSMCVSVHKHVWALSFFQYFKLSFAL